MIKLNTLLLFIPFVFLLVSTSSQAESISSKNIVLPVDKPVSEDDDARWIEIKNSAVGGENASATVNAKGDGLGDRMVIVESGDSLEKIALFHTGDRENWNKIARHNGIGHDQTLTAGSILLIPEALLQVSALAPGVEKKRYDSEIKEFDTDTSSTQSTSTVVSDSKQNSSSQQPTIQPIEVMTRNVDMFVGQVSVFGKVAVDRVAIGKGSVVRAEVLKTGELLVIAQSEGSSSLRLWHKDGQQSDFNIRVGASDPETRFHMEKMIRLKVKMVEFRKSSLGKLGIDWGDSVTGPTFATAGDFVTNSIYRPAAEGFSGTINGAVKPFSSYFGIASSLASKINFLSTSGDAVVLAEPTLSCANGGSARFLAGGEVPYPTVQANGQTTIEFKEYGIRLEVAPRIDTAGNVQTSVMTEISSIDASVTVQGAPGLLTRRTQTQVNVRTGQTIVISGLLKSENSKDIDKVPGIGNLPVIGRLFKSDNVRKDLSELVIFITPEVMNPESEVMTERHNEINTKSNAMLQRGVNSLNLKLLE